MANNKAQLFDAVELASCVHKKYQQLNDDSRSVKCFNLLGDIYLKLYLLLADEPDRELWLREANSKYKLGAQESERLARYDELLDNYYGWAQTSHYLGQNCDDIRKKGQIISALVKNEEKYLEFEMLNETKHIILVRHGESEKNIKKIISGIGSLTQNGKLRISKRASEISDFLAIHRIPHEQVKIYGQNKAQINESMHIIENVLSGATVHNDDRLAPAGLGIITGKSEKEIIGSEAYIALERWRNKEIYASELVIEQMESPKDYWKRTEEFIREITNKNRCTIVVCTTSMAVLLTNYLLGNDVSTGKYKCLNIPLCGMIHFRNDFGRYVLCNRDTSTNILYSKLDSSD